MIRLFNVFVVLAFFVTAANAELEIRDVQASHGLLGPERSSLDCYPYDEVFFRYTVLGAEIDEEGKVDIEIGIRLTDASGKVVLDEKGSMNGVLAFGGPSFPGTAHVALSAAPPGQYTVTVTVKDRLAGAEASFERTLNFKPAGFAIVTPRFFFDAEGKIPAPLGGFTGQKLYFSLRAIGFDLSQSKIGAEMLVQIFDKEGRPLMPKPIQATVRSEDPKVVKQATVLTFRGDFALNRAGEFTLRVTVNDLIGKKSTVFDAPLRVQEP